MDIADVPSFDEWVEYCLVRGYPEFCGHVPCEGSERFLAMPGAVLIGYLTRLFEAPAFIAGRCTDDQIGNAVWFIFGVGSCYVGRVLKEPAPAEVRARFVRSVSTMYTDLFDRVCGGRGKDPDSDLRETRRVDGAVYMIWDMDNLGYVFDSPDLVEPALGVLETVLERCRTSACIVSALHGIGHAHRRWDLRERRERMVDELLARRQLPGWLAEYARYARAGGVQ